jgi:hypothetical protein
MWQMKCNCQEFLDVIHTISQRHGISLKDLPKSIDTINEHYKIAMNSHESDESEVTCIYNLKSFKYYMDANLFRVIWTLQNHNFIQIGTHGAG